MEAWLKLHKVTKGQQCDDIKNLMYINTGINFSLMKISCLSFTLCLSLSWVTGQRGSDLMVTKKNHAEQKSSSLNARFNLRTKQSFACRQDQNGPRMTTFILREIY